MENLYSGDGFSKTAIFLSTDFQTSFTRRSILVQNVACLSIKCSDCELQMLTYLTHLFLQIFIFSLKDILYLLIDRPWPAPHVNSDTSNMRSVQHLLLWSESHCHGSVREHFLNIYIKKPLKGGNSPLSSLSLYESFYECFSLKIRNSG